MKGKKLIFVLILLAICIGVYFVVKRLDLDKTDSGKEETVYVNQMEAGEITGFSYVSGEDTLSFSKDGDTWRYDGDQQLSMNQTSITSMVAALAEIQAMQALDDHEELSEYGLDTPSNTISIKAKEGTKELIIGNKNEAADGYYAMINGEDKVYLISSSLPSKFSAALDTLEETEAEETTAEDETAAEGETASQE
ncbi:DUF4340 domain-containing protein [Qiania dongpingensis]|uniref:DUF4340 domain-containing protein n=1 Tax=Qiania dongpingensis TaxID=2763669 RepID=A0A7G9G162_9FIRM|nr:DUF4340 domain-containing protein [Qiania dongpingensis]QNM04544.1 DUF4340 domain-containing protein [Qiania dongpingensis]